jgi:hypothetical protein
MLVILATLEAEIGRTVVQSQASHKVLQEPFQPISGHGGICLSSQLGRRLKTTVLGQP